MQPAITGKEVTYLEAIRQAMFEEMRRDPNVFAIGEDIGQFGGAFKVTKGLLDEFGADRVIDAPIAESAIVGAAIGAAMCGMRPIVEMQFADFVTNAYNMLVSNAAKAHYRWSQSVPMVVRCPSGGGIHGGPFHSTNPEGIFFHIPGLKLVCPSTPNDARGLLKAAVRDNNPVLFFEHKFLYRRAKEVLVEGDGVVEIGVARVVRPGRDASVITYGSTVHMSVEAAEKLAQEGYEVEIVDLRTVLPWDRQTVLNSVKKTARALVVHEDTRTGGIGAEVAATISELCFEWLDAPVMRVASHDTPVPFAPPLEEFFMPSAKKIEDELRTLLQF